MLNSQLRQITRSLQTSPRDLEQIASELCQQQIVALQTIESPLPLRQPRQSIRSKFRLISLQTREKRNSSSLMMPKLTVRSKRSSTIPDRIAPYSPRSPLSLKFSRLNYGVLTKNEAQTSRLVRRHNETAHENPKIKIELNETNSFRKQSKQKDSLRGERYQFQGKFRHSQNREEMSNQTAQDEEDVIRFLPSIKNTQKSIIFQKPPTIKGTALRKLTRENFRKWVEKRPSKKLKKYVNVILFTIRLRKFNEKIRAYHKQSFHLFLKRSLLAGLQKMKQQLIAMSQPLLNQIKQYDSFDLSFNQQENSILFEYKLKTIKNLAFLQLQCLRKGIKSMINKDLFRQTLYHICRQGSYSCLHRLYTAEQLNCLCLSQQHGYIRGGKHLQQTALLLLVFIKLLVFNFFLQPMEIDWKIFKNYRNINTINKNFVFLGNVLYSLFVDVQDELTQQTEADYPIGNWKQLRHYFSIKAAESMTVKQGIFFENQLISGLRSRNQMQHVLGFEFINSCKVIMRQMLADLHNMMGSYHKKIKCYFFDL